MQQKNAEDVKSKSPDRKKASKEYHAPKLTVWGSVEELTACGYTNDGQDTMGGSVRNPGAC